MENNTGIDIYKCLNKFREPLLHEVISSLNLPPVSKGLDIACGTGFITRLLANFIDQRGSVTGVDISGQFIQFASENHKSQNIEFLTGDINNLPFEENSFDWIWSMDTVWPGEKEFGCPDKEPYKIINSFYKILKPGGNVCISYWTSQKLLPGYPLLEAKLNTLFSANAPYSGDMDPKIHVLNAAQWLKKSQFQNIEIKTFTGNISAPLSENTKEALKILFNMLWYTAENELSQDDYILYQKLCFSDTDDCVLNNPDYYGFYTYTVFKAQK